MKPLVEPSKQPWPRLRYFHNADRCDALSSIDYFTENVPYQEIMTYTALYYIVHTKFSQIDWKFSAMVKLTSLSVIATPYE